jgi:glutaredoxin 3
VTSVVIYTKDWCSYCRAAKQLLSQLGYTYLDIDVTHDVTLYQEMRGKAEGRSTVPQIFVDGEGIGGYTDLVALLREKRLPPP